MSATEEQLAHLAMWVKRRRIEELDWTQLDVYGNGGPSNSTLTAIENAVKTPDRATLRKLDAGLEWAPGSARRVLYEMGEPELRYPVQVEANTSLREAIAESKEIGESTRRVLLMILDGAPRQSRGA